MGLMSNLVDKEPICFEEETKYKEWVDVMVKEYQSILKNYLWEIVPRPKYKLVVSSRSLLKIKHVADSHIEKYKARFVACRFS